jgi:hypothetical protein
MKGKELLERKPEGKSLIGRSVYSWENNVQIHRQRRAEQQHTGQILKQLNDYQPL